VIIGVGVDVCEVGRFEASLRRTPELAERLFTPGERDRPMQSLAARFAAKEAVAKALGAPAGLSWHDAEVVAEDSGRPVLELRGSVLAAAEAAGARSWHLSLSHDAGIAMAFVVMEGDPVR
jgi:holo-[acyl-carrier protein] synthase